MSMDNNPVEHSSSDGQPAQQARTEHFTIVDRQKEAKLLVE